MKNKFRASAILAVLAVCALLFPTAIFGALPPYMDQIFSGNVTINGAPAPDGTLVSAHIGSVEYVNTTTTAGAYTNLIFPGDDPGTGPKEGGAPGDTIVFKVSGVVAASVPFTQGDVTTLDLAVTITETIPPTVTANSPTGSNVLVNSNISATFSEAMNTASVESAFSIAPSVAGAFGWTDNTTTFNPTASLAYDTTYTVTIAGTAQDLAGNGLDGNENDVSQGSPTDDYSWSFTTESDPTGDVEIQMAMLLDSSGSIGSYNWPVIIEGLASAVENSTCVPQDGTLELTVVRFGGSASVVVGPVVVTSGNADDVAADIRAIPYTGGGTCMSCAFTSAANALVNSDNYSASIKQVINLVTDGHPSSAPDSETARDNAISTLAMTESQDEIDAEAIGGGADVEWMRDYIVYPQPGYEAPPFDEGAGWVRTVGDVAEFAETICEKFAVIITPPATPNADFSGSPRIGVASLRVIFADRSTGDINTWAWDFGDGGTSTEQNPTYIYTAAGRYTVSLTVTGPGGSDTETKTAYIIVRRADVTGPPEPPNFVAAYLHISPQQVKPNQQVEISINIANNGGEKGSHSAALYINGYLEDSRTVGVSAGSSQLVVFTLSKSDPGTYQVSLEGQAGQFTVMAPAETSLFGGPLGTGGIIVIVIVAIAIIVAVIFLLRGRPD